MEDEKKILPFNYLRLVSICEGDINTAEGNYIQSFLFVCRGLDNKEYICPVYCHDNHKAGLRKALQRIKPLILGDYDKNATKKEEPEFPIQQLHFSDILDS